MALPGERKTLRQLAMRDRYLLLMFLPVFIYYIIFCYLLMAGLTMAFQDFKMGSGFLGVFTGEWVGLKWFKQFFSSVFAKRLIRNTFLLNFYSLIFGFPIPIIFAICITQMRQKRLAKAAQVITYLPYFISTVVVVGMSLLYAALGFGRPRREEKGLRITIPENLDYSGVFDDLWPEYTTAHELTRVKSTNMGSLFQLSYRITMRDSAKEKALLDEIRCRNGNLEVSLSKVDWGKDAL